MSSKFTDEQLKAALEETGGNMSAAARILGCAKSTVQKALRRHPDTARAGGLREPLSTKTAHKGRSLTDFKHAYDKDTIIPGKVNAALKELGASWEYESEFVRRAGVSYADLGNYRDQFAAHIITIRSESKRVWAGTASFAEQLREMV